MSEIHTQEGHNQFIIDDAIWLLSWSCNDAADKKGNTMPEAPSHVREDSMALVSQVATMNAPEASSAYQSVSDHMPRPSTVPTIKRGLRFGTDEFRWSRRLRSWRRQNRVQAALEAESLDDDIDDILTIRMAPLGGSSFNDVKSQEIRKVPGEVDMLVGQWKSHFPNGQCTTMKLNHRQPATGFKKVSKSFTYVLRHCRSIPHWDDVAVAISESFDELNDRAAGDFPRPPPNGPVRLADQLELGSDRPRRQHSSYGEQGNPRTLQPDLVQWQRLRDAEAPMLFPGARFCNSTPPSSRRVVCRGCFRKWLRPKRYLPQSEA